MEVHIHANITDRTTSHLAETLRPLLKELGLQLTGQYGGVIEHLWIDLELVESHARPSGPRFPFRFQKRVSGRAPFGLPSVPDTFNVGHFSVRPDFRTITSLAPDQIKSYVLSLVYDATAVLIEKQKKLGGFDATLFRKNFSDACQRLGFTIPIDTRN